MLEMQKHLFHANGRLGLVEHRVVALLVVLLAGSLVAQRLSGALLAVGNDITVEESQLRWKG